MKKLINDFLFAIQTDRSLIAKGISIKVTETTRNLDRCCYLWGKGRTREDFENVGLGSRANFADPMADKVTWVKNPKDTRHYNGTAFDIAIGKGFWGRLTTLIWGKTKVLEYVCKVANRVGLRSLGLVYGRDYYHFEMPIAFQGQQTNCYAYSIANAMQKVRYNDRYYSDKPFHFMAKEITETMDKTMIPSPIKGRGDAPMQNTLKNALTTALTLRYIKGFQKIKVGDLKNGMLAVVAQKSVGVPKYIKHKGYRGHAYTFEAKDLKGRLYFRNSYFDDPIIQVDRKVLEKYCNIYQVV